MLLYNLKLCWWNIALSPASPKATSHASDESYGQISEHIKFLFEIEHVDFLAVCEISETDVDKVLNELNFDTMSALPLCDKVGRTRFDIAVFYNKNKITIETDRSITKIIENNTIKAAQVVNLYNLDDGEKISIFLCHWASRLNGNGFERRAKSARLVNDYAMQIMESGEHVIVMGDFNDNPYDSSMIDHLDSSRCIETVARYPKQYLYNPFWREIISAEKYSHTSCGQLFRSGTLKYKSGAGTLWHTYDQMLFSGSFLGQGDWHLNEHETKVLSREEFIEPFDDKDSFIDHMPIVSELTRVPTEVIE
ncbi:endonuclease/exonuclease/phosphatase family protein [Microbulbifer sp. SSSA008]|uniref:endonuclease/exonuclease/phosphatase family protein n=1 Tax=Microbulbifer sp. SSSA008 TaxID=3243380 RepID=UPI0040395B98